MKGCVSVTFAVCFSTLLVPATPSSLPSSESRSLAVHSFSPVPPSIAPTFEPSTEPALYDAHRMHEIMHWSFLLPLVSISLMVWALRKNPGQYVCCGNYCTDSVPEEIIAVDEDSVVGNASTDMELQPVHTFYDPRNTGVDKRADLEKDATSTEKYVLMD